MVFPSLVNATNQSIEGVLTITTTAPGISPDVLYLAPAIAIIGFFLLFLYMAETRRDIGYAMFMMALSGMAFNDPFLSSVEYDVTVVATPANLPLLLVFVALYEVIMTLLLMNELRNRKKDSGGSDGE